MSKKLSITEEQLTSGHFGRKPKPQSKPTQSKPKKDLKFDDDKMSVISEAEIAEAQEDHRKAQAQVKAIKDTLKTMGLDGGKRRRTKKKRRKRRKQRRTKKKRKRRRKRTRKK